jgi:two-component system, chemotaxis family, chemotaxis protein CheY
MAINVLIVDDSAVMRAMILKTMRMSGLPLGDIYQASDGRQGLKALNEHWIDLVLLDINMPVMNGEQMIDCMIEDPELKDTPIVVISTEGSQTRIERLQRKGTRFVHKPFSPEILRNTVKDILGTGADNECKN